MMTPSFAGGGALPQSQGGTCRRVQGAFQSRDSDSTADSDEMPGPAELVMLKGQVASRVSYGWSTR